MRPYKYKHYSFQLAEKEYRSGSRKLYRVTTINWTISQNKPVMKVHKNQYVMTLNQLTQWTRETFEVAEDIVSIQPVRSVNDQWTLDGCCGGKGRCCHGTDGVE